MKHGFDSLDVRACEGVPEAMLDCVEAEIIATVTEGRRALSPEGYRLRVGDLVARIQAMPPAARDMLRGRFSMEVRA